VQRKPAIFLSSLLIVVVLLSSGPVTLAQSQAPTRTPTVTGTRSTAQTQTPAATPSAAATQTETPAAQPTATPISGDRYFQETGFNVPPVFVKYWDAHGGLPIFGFPISEARNERNLADGKQYLVQYFERNRFEYHPELEGTPHEVLLGLLGVELTRGRTFPTVQAFTESPSRVYMEPTGHSLGEPFLSYWKQYGGLEIFGYPISEPFQEVNSVDGNTYLVQYFERNRFEFHPENKAPYDVLLGLLGKDFMELQESINPWGPPIPGGVAAVDPLWTPAKPAAGGKFVKGPTVGDGMIVQAYHQDRDRIMNMINDLSFTWIKQQVEWKDTENPKGVYYWEELDRVVNAAQAHNVKVLVTVVKAPTWATGGFNGFPKNPQDLGDFMQAMATHFKGRVGAYEVWNEANLSGESGDVNPARYVEMLKAAYVGIKAVDPAAVVVTGAPAPTGVNDPEGKRAPGAMGVLSDLKYLEDMYLYHDGEVRAYFDALGSHPYGFNNPPDTKWPDNPNMNPDFPLNAGGQRDYYNLSNSFYFRRIEQQRAIMEKYGDAQKQMWVTEYGWCSDYRPDGYGECKYVTPELQGQYIVRAIARSKEVYPWMGVMFLWNLNFSTFQEWYTGPSHFSILNADWSGRPAYFALRNRPR
jgi:polysaccharide biosynthesis protein PslG